MHQQIHFKIELLCCSPESSVQHIGTFLYDAHTSLSLFLMVTYVHFMDMVFLTHWLLFGPLFMMSYFVGIGVIWKL